MQARARTGLDSDQTAGGRGTWPATLPSPRSAPGRRWSAGRAGAAARAAGATWPRAGSARARRRTRAGSDLPGRRHAGWSRRPPTAHRATRARQPASASTGASGSSGGASGFVRPFRQGLRRVRRARPVDQGIARHLEQPGARVVERAEALTLAHGLDEDVLQHVVGRVGVRQAVPQVAQQLGLVGLPGRRHAGERVQVKRRHAPFASTTALPLWGRPYAAWRRRMSSMLSEGRTARAQRRGDDGTVHQDRVDHEADQLRRRSTPGRRASARHRAFPCGATIHEA